MSGLRLLQFTPVELAFLARAANTDAGRTTSRKLLLGDEASDAVVASGYGGLRLRGWASAGGDGLELDPAIEGMADVFGAASRWIQLSFLGADEASSVLVVEGERMAVVIRPLEAGVVDVSAVDPGHDPVAICAQYIAAFLASESPVTVAVEMESTGGSRSAAARNVHGAWSFVTTADGEAVDGTPGEGITALDVSTKLARWLAAV